MQYNVINVIVYCLAGSRIERKPGNKRKYPLVMYTCMLDRYFLLLP